MPLTSTNPATAHTTEYEWWRYTRRDSGGTKRLLEWRAQPISVAGSYTTPEELEWTAT